MRHLKIETGSDGIATIIMDNADASMNVASDAFMTELADAIAMVRSDADVTGVIVTSGKAAFMAGADLTELVKSFGSMTVRDAFALSQRANALHRSIELCGKPWVAVINGLALGAGLELALACHHRILVEDLRASIGLPEVNLGLMPGAGGTQRLIWMIGVAAASDLLLTGRSVPPAEALKLQLVDAVLPAEQAMAQARAWLATKPDPVRAWDVKGALPPQKRGMLVPEDSAAYMFAAGQVAAKAGYNMPAPLAILSTIFEGAQLPFDKGLAIESKYFARLLTSPVARNIIRTTFVSKLAAEKGARRPAGIAKSAVRKLGVIGAGMMGAGIAFVSAKEGVDVVLIDRDMDAAEKGKAYSVSVAGGLLGKGRLRQDAMDALLARIVPTDDYRLLTGCDLVIEAVFEDVAIKAETTARAEGMMPRASPFASNTSTLPITQLARASSRPEQFIGIHFFSPVERMALVEVIVGEQTSPETLAKALDFIGQLRKTPIVVNDGRGFYTSRVFQTFIHEGGAMLEEGVPAAVIENAAKAIGMPVGPLAVLDDLGFDLPIRIVEQTLAEAGEGHHPPAGIAAMRKMRDALGRGGRKAGAGFYDYPAEGKKHLWSGLADHFPVRRGWDIEALKQRFLYAQAIESARCMEEDIVETPQDADLGSVYGWGFPAWTGGTISYIDTIGVTKFVSECDRLAQAHGSRFSPSPWLREKAARNEPFYPA